LRHRAVIERARHWRDEINLSRRSTLEKAAAWNLHHHVELYRLRSPLLKRNWLHGIVNRPYKIKGAYGNLDRLTQCGANRRHGPVQHRRCVEHSRPHALRCHRLSGPSARESSNHREGKNTVGETSLVREPMASEAERCSICSAVR